MVTGLKDQSNQKTFQSEYRFHHIQPSHWKVSDLAMNLLTVLISRTSLSHHSISQRVACLHLYKGVFVKYFAHGARLTGRSMAYGFIVVWQPQSRCLRTLLLGVGRKLTTVTPRRGTSDERCRGEGSRKAALLLAEISSDIFLSLLSFQTSETRHSDSLSSSWVYGRCCFSNFLPGRGRRFESPRIYQKFATFFYRIGTFC